MSQIVETDASADRYVIQERIAGGGMGRIYRGVKKGIGGFEKPVVLKQLLPELASDPELVDLFFREAHIHAALEHANIVHIIDLVVSDNDYFIVLEYVRGTDLYRVIRLLRKRSELLPIPAALFIAREVFKALDYAHGRTDEDGRPLGIVHRDISPTNILLSAAGEVKITDFGIARSATDSSGFINVRGKLAYMSPEQAMGDPLDHRTDLYSAAVCAYEMLAGQRPLPTIKNLADARGHFDLPIKPLARVRPTCPPELDDILLQTLSPDPDLRPQSAGEILAVLEQITNENKLFYSARKLAEFLEDLLGPDPATWSDTKDYASPSSRSGGIQRDDDSRKEPAPRRRGLIGIEATSLHLRRGLRRRGLPAPKSGLDRAIEPAMPQSQGDWNVMAAARRAPLGPDGLPNPTEPPPPGGMPSPPPPAASLPPSAPGSNLPGGPPLPVGGNPPPPTIHPPAASAGLNPMQPPRPQASVPTNARRLPPPPRAPLQEEQSDWVGKTLLAVGLSVLGLIVFWLVVKMAGL